MKDLSEDAQHLLTELFRGALVPKSTIEGQWSPESRRAFQELIQARMVEEVCAYRVRVIEKRDPPPDR